MEHFITSLLFLPTIIFIIIITVIVYLLSVNKIKINTKYIIINMICLFVLLVCIHLVSSSIIRNYANIEYSKSTLTYKLYPLEKDSNKNILIYHNNDIIQFICEDDEKNIKIRNINIKNVTFIDTDMGTITISYPKYKNIFLDNFFIMTKNEPMYFISVPKNTIKSN